MTNLGHIISRHPLKDSNDFSRECMQRARLVAELNKEQEAFIASKNTEKGEAVAPWVGAPNEDVLREECLSLSLDQRNFLKSPPKEVDFPWNFEAVQPMAQATLALDPNLESMRFQLVPKLISEESFWRNYFYRVSVLRQSHELNTMANQAENNQSAGSVEHAEGNPNSVWHRNEEFQNFVENFFGYFATNFGEIAGSFYKIYAVLLTEPLMQSRSKLPSSLYKLLEAVRGSTPPPLLTPGPSSLAVSVVLRTVQMTTGQESNGTMTAENNNTFTDSPGHEFVSDSMRVTDTDLEEVREGMKKLGMQPPKG
ncbi:Synapse-associated protein of 47 kDa [Melipona quadrifasciata]|uniref:Synapse-associated protein of 47 kDa n=1 Tax=Melipona quadrifasciata TaxID=166423 RepID=A0A0M8ZYL1_9HYME|nr:Synapse-associated protein of 47 kDa [Melipona quadrifasciata]